jgi:hypothetical protein
MLHLPTSLISFFSEGSRKNEDQPQGRALAQAVSRWLPTVAARVPSRVWSSGICGGQSGAGAGVPCQSSFHQILHHHNHPGQATRVQSVAAVPSGPSWTSPPIKRIKKKITP